MTDDPTRVAATIAALTGGEPPRVWSLLVTVFGDLGQGDGARFSGAVLTRLTGDIGLRPEATRVALHRLRKEGWITSQRSGRHSDHHLTDWGRAQIAAASPRIYARDAPASAACLVLSVPGMAEPDGIALRPGVTLTSHPDPRPQAFCQQITPGTPLPAWMQDRICPHDTQALAAQTATRLATAQRLLPDPATLSALDIATLRVLTVHAWRRVALRAPDLPDALLPPTFKGPACRATAMALLARLPAPSLPDLEAEATARTAA